MPPAVLHFQDGRRYAHIVRRSTELRHTEKTLATLTHVKLQIKNTGREKSWMKKAWHARMMNDGGEAAQTVIYKYPSKETLMYEASLSCSPTITYMPTQNEQQ